jgi:hypothetical protein
MDPFVYNRVEIYLPFVKGSNEKRSRLLIYYHITSLPPHSTCFPKYIPNILYIPFPNIFPTLTQIYHSTPTLPIYRIAYILPLIPLNHIKPDLCSTKFNQVISYSFSLIILYTILFNVVYPISCGYVSYNVLELYFNHSISFNIIFYEYISPGPLPSTIGLYRDLRRHIGGLWGIYAGIVLVKVCKGV